jgi:hypothetical protein
VIPAIVVPVIIMGPVVIAIIVAVIIAVPAVPAMIAVIIPIAVSERDVASVEIDADA